MTVDIHDAETQLSELAAKVLADDCTIVITNAGIPIVDLVPHQEDNPRNPGGYAIDMTGFDDTDATISVLFEGN